MRSWVQSSLGAHNALSTYKPPHLGGSSNQQVAVRARTDRGYRCSCCTAGLTLPVGPHLGSLLCGLGQCQYSLHSLSPCCFAGILEMPRSNSTNAPEHQLHTRHWSSEVADAALPWETPEWTQDPMQVIQNHLKSGLGTLSGDS